MQVFVVFKAHREARLKFALEVESGCIPLRTKSTSPAQSLLQPHQHLHLQ